MSRASQVYTAFVAELHKYDQSRRRLSVISLAITAFSLGLLAAYVITPNRALLALTLAFALLQLMARFFACEWYANRMTTLMHTLQEAAIAAPWTFGYILFQTVILLIGALAVCAVCFAAGVNTQVIVVLATLSMVAAGLIYSFRHKNGLGDLVREVQSLVDERNPHSDAMKTAPLKWACVRIEARYRQSAAAGRCAECAGVLQSTYRALSVQLLPYAHPDKLEIALLTRAVLEAADLGQKDWLTNYFAEEAFGSDPVAGLLALARDTGKSPELRLCCYTAAHLRTDGQEPYQSLREVALTAVLRFATRQETATMLSQGLDLLRQALRKMLAEYPGTDALSLDQEVLKRLLTGFWVAFSEKRLAEPMGVFDRDLRDLNRLALELQEQHPEDGDISYVQIVTSEMLSRIGP